MKMEVLPGDARPLVVHVIYRLDFGGLETLLVDCINHMPAERGSLRIFCRKTNHLLTLH